VSEAKKSPVWVSIKIKGSETVSGPFAGYIAKGRRGKENKEEKHRKEKGSRETRGEHTSKR